MAVCLLLSSIFKNLNIHCMLLSHLKQTLCIGLRECQIKGMCSAAGVGSRECGSRCPTGMGSPKRQVGRLELVGTLPYHTSVCPGYLQEKCN